MDDLERSMEIETEERNEVIIPPERRYYKAPINLEEAERYITSGLVTAARAYVANGYYLRRIRDDRLFEEDGYTNFESYVRDRYGKDKGWASKCIKVNQQLSVDGDSPLLDGRYQEYSTYQLVELAYMTEEQREQVTPEQTVKELHKIRVPEKVVTSQLAEEEDDDNIPGQMEIEEFPEYLPEGYHAEETALSEDVQEPEQTFQMPAESIFPRIPDESWNLGDLPQAKERYLREFAECFVKDPSNQSALMLKPDEALLIIRIKSWQTQQGGIIRLSDGLEASASEMVVEFYKDDEDLGCASYQRLITQIGKALDAYVAKLTEKEAEPNVIEEPAPEETRDQRESAEEQEEETDNCIYDLPIECPVAVECEEICCEDCQLIECERRCPECKPKQKSPAEYDRKILLDMIQNAKKVLEQMADYWRENQPRTYTKHRMELAAYLSFLEQNDTQEEEPEPEKQEQEPLPILRNNDQRKEWLNGYQSWPVWFEVPEASEVYYRYDLPDGSSLVVCEYHQWIYWREKFTSGDPDGIGTREYILPAGGYHYLADCSSNRSAMIEKLKEVQKNGK